MQTLVLRIPDELARELQEEAERLNLSKSEVARRRLTAPTTPTAGFDLIADLVGSVETGPTDMSNRKKDYLKSTGYGKAKRDR
ncbi:ribbon-helix-helix protein, CopG family [Luteolibacter sp. Populi]|uniref:ribbon-helix-helix protein, CopG family n=1 Tax=Luteolibacter sp. Populi TaxID=3230487 RepID=UPI003467E607